MIWAESRGPGSFPIGVGESERQPSSVSSGVPHSDPEKPLSVSQPILDPSAVQSDSVEIYAETFSKGIDFSVEEDISPGLGHWQSLIVSGSARCVSNECCLIDDCSMA